MSQFPTVGVIGGGQLARMMQQAAIPLGIRLRLLAERADDAAAQVIPDSTVGDHRDLGTLREFAAACDVVTFDHEHVPAEHLTELVSGGVTVRPAPTALVHAQDKILMRERLSAADVPCPQWRSVAPMLDQAVRGSAERDLAEFADDVGGWPVVLKAVSGGYDGKGVWVVDDASAASAVLHRARGLRFLVEEYVPFKRELAALVARSPHGQAVAYQVVETVQVDGICREVIAPAPELARGHSLGAVEIALEIAQELDVTGLLAVEMFEVAEGVLVNELAMRPHNSGHWTIDGATTSQFEQHLRAVLDLPLGSPAPRAPYTVMVNVLGGRPEVYERYVHCMAHDPALRIHMYGKQFRPGRKIGHVTVSGADLEELLARARHAAAYLQGDSDG